MNDCTFQYFKATGKWGYEGRGVFPRPPAGGGYYEVDRAAIAAANNGMPGISGDATHMFVIVLPDEDCDVNTAFPRMLKPII